MIIRFRIPIHILTRASPIRIPNPSQTSLIPTTPMIPRRHIPHECSPIPIRHDKHIRSFTRQGVFESSQGSVTCTIDGPDPVFLRAKTSFGKFVAALIPTRSLTCNPVGAVVDEGLFAGSGTAVAEFGEEGKAVVGSLLVIFCERLVVKAVSHDDGQSLMERGFNVQR